ncbi:MAG: nickel-dependent hydrogenase large subunit [Crenarchaeota archaeon]|nr:nickel-dependent hydrogenase large subunit [Thermoproteota archaeon]
MGMYVPIGPYHPALKEPITIKIKVEGEKIVDADIELGYNHRGIEKLLESKLWISVPFISEHICGICSGVHQMTAIMGIERIFDMEDKIPERARMLRIVGLELERIHSHLLWLGVAAHESGFDTIFMYTWRDRESILDLLEMQGGRRVVYSIGKVGGVRRDVDDKFIRKAKETMNYIKKRAQEYMKTFEEDLTLLARFKNVALLPYDVAVNLGAVGPTARASGIDYDVRWEDRYFGYSEEIGLRVAVRKEGDALAKALVRLDEIIISAEIIENVLENLPAGPIELKFPPLKTPAPGEAVARSEAPRGELIYYYRSDGKRTPYRVKVRTPTMANILSAGYMVRGGYIADVPVAFATIDPCIACMERCIIVDDGKQVRKLDWAKLKHYANKWFNENWHWIKEERIY